MDAQIAKEITENSLANSNDRHHLRKMKDIEKLAKATKASIERANFKRTGNSDTMKGLSELLPRQKNA